jgi:hypothetical protein
MLIFFLIYGLLFIAKERVTSIRYQTQKNNQSLISKMFCMIGYMPMKPRKNVLYDRIHAYET